FMPGVSRNTSRNSSRWGGEEFLLVFRDTPGMKGRAIAERLRERIAGAGWPEGRAGTCSFSVAEWHRGEDLTEGIKRADVSLGHDTGDQVIRGLVELVRSAVQHDDLFARWGGEEFLLVFRDTPGM